MDAEVINAIENLIGYEFKNKQLLVQAFTRKSVTDENPQTENYEVLEFLGDKILSFVLAKEYSDYFGSIDDDNQYTSKESEGYLTQRHVDLTQGSNLTRIAQVYGLSDFIRKSVSDKITEKSYGDIIESVLGAVAVDSNWDVEALTNIVNNLVHPEDNFSKRYTLETFYEKLKRICEENNFSINELIVSQNEAGGFVSKISVSKSDDIQLFKQKGKSKKGVIEGISRQAYIHVKLFWLHEAVENSIMSPVAQLLFLEQKKVIKEVQYKNSLDKTNHKKWVSTCIVIDNNEKVHAKTGIADKNKAAQKIAAASILPEIIESTKPDNYSGKGILWLIENKYKNIL